MGAIASFFIQILKKLFLNTIGATKVINLIKAGKSTIKGIEKFKFLTQAEKQIFLKRILKRKTKQVISNKISGRITNKLFGFSELDIDLGIADKTLKPLNKQKNIVYKKINTPLMKLINWLFRSKGSPKEEEIFVEKVKKSKILRKEFNENFSDNGSESESMVIGLQSSWISWGIYEPLRHMKGKGLLTIKISNKFSSSKNPSLIYKFGIHTPPISYTQWKQVIESANGGTTFWDVYFRSAKLSVKIAGKDEDWNFTNKERKILKNA